VTQHGHGLAWLHQSHWEYSHLSFSDFVDDHGTKASSAQHPCEQGDTTRCSRRPDIDSDRRSLSLATGIAVSSEPERHGTSLPLTTIFTNEITGLSVLFLSVP
jgi:hypothetical protein